VLYGNSWEPVHRLRVLAVLTLCLYFAGCGESGSSGSSGEDLNIVESVDDQSSENTSSEGTDTNQLPVSAAPEQPTDSQTPTDKQNQDGDTGLPVDDATTAPSIDEPTSANDVAADSIDQINDDVPADVGETLPPENTQTPDEPTQSANGEFDPDTVSVVVTEAESPVDGSAGIKRALNNNSTLFLLGGEGSTDKLEIIANPDLTDGDMRTAIGGAFYQFAGDETTASPMVVLDTSENLDAVYECNFEQSRCEAIFVDLVSENALSFAPRPGWHYVFVRSEP